MKITKDYLRKLVLESLGQMQTAASVEENNLGGSSPGSMTLAQIATEMPEQILPLIMNLIKTNPEGAKQVMDLLRPPGKAQRV